MKISLFNLTLTENPLTSADLHHDLPVLILHLHKVTEVTISEPPSSGRMFGLSSGKPAPFPLHINEDELCLDLLLPARPWARHFHFRLLCVQQQTIGRRPAGINCLNQQSVVNDDRTHRFTSRRGSEKITFFKTRDNFCIRPPD